MIAVSSPRFFRENVDLMGSRERWMRLGKCVESIILKMMQNRRFNRSSRISVECSPIKVRDGDEEESVRSGRLIS